MRVMMMLTASGAANCWGAVGEKVRFKSINKINQTPARGKITRPASTPLCSLFSGRF